MAFDFSCLDDPQRQILSKFDVTRSSSNAKVFISVQTKN